MEPNFLAVRWCTNIRPEPLVLLRNVKLQTRMSATVSSQLKLPDFV